ncbi:MAG TPA: polysaccharide deacetylase family protein [Bacteroidota bacterium]|nr:polysaccharide deacetylase family protein [Bacteroidota bacterium]
MRVLFGLLLLTLPLFAQTKEICVTIDDLPVVGGDRNDLPFQRAVTRDLLKALTKYRVPAIGFVNESKLYTNGTPDSNKVALLQQWLDKGMELGNHTYLHKDYNSVSFAEMAEDVEKGERTVSQLLESRGRRLQYFRQPFLHRGNSKGKVDSLAAFLSARGYTEAPVTIDNGDWIYAAAYLKAWTAGDSVRMKLIGLDYVIYMEKKLMYYEAQSKKLFGYKVKQTLLIHASRLNADFFESLAQMLKRHRYKFVPLSVALADTAYRSADTFYRNGGISWLDRWALTAGKKGQFFKDEPTVPKMIMNAAGVESE